MQSLEKILHGSISSFAPRKEENEYEAASFICGNTRAQYRKAKITPKKEGAFVAIWTRSSEGGETRPYSADDGVDLLIIHVVEREDEGFFVFPKKVCLEKGLFTGSHPGKRGTRVYPPWCSPTNKTAAATKQWQQEYFKSIPAAFGKGEYDEKI